MESVERQCQKSGVKIYFRYQECINLFTIYTIRILSYKKLTQVKWGWAVSLVKPHWTWFLNTTGLYCLVKVFGYRTTIPRSRLLLGLRLRMLCVVMEIQPSEMWKRPPHTHEIHLHPLMGWCGQPSWAFSIFTVFRVTAGWMCMRDLWETGKHLVLFYMIA